MNVIVSTDAKTINLSQQNQLVTLAPDSDNSTVTMGVRSVELAPPEPNVPTPVLEVLQEEGHEIIPKGFTNVKVDEVQQSYLKKDNIRSELASKQCGSSHQTLDSAEGASNSDLILDSSVLQDSTAAMEDEDNSNEDGADGRGATLKYNYIMLPTFAGLPHPSDPCYLNTQVEDVTIVKCTKCQTKVFMDIEEFEAHAITHHNLCKECGATFSSKYLLTKHMRTHTPHTCHVCDKTFTSQSNLKTHSQLHTGNKQYQCDHCDESFFQNVNLQSHIRTHTGEKPFSCHVCHKKFSGKTNLTRHIRTHTGEKNFKCNVCYKKFTQSSDLKTHIRTHTGEKPFSCNVCTEQFRQKSHLRTHIRTHTGEKPFQCSYCGVKFKQNSNLTQHIKNIHKGKK